MFISSLDEASKLITLCNALTQTAKRRVDINTWPYQMSVNRKRRVSRSQNKNIYLSAKCGCEFSAPGGVSLI